MSKKMKKMAHTVPHVLFQVTFWTPSLPLKHGAECTTASSSFSLMLKCTSGQQLGKATLVCNTLVIFWLVLCPVCCCPCVTWFPRQGGLGIANLTYYLLISFFIFLILLGISCSLWFQDTVSVHRPGFYADRFLKFMSTTVFRKTSCEYTSHAGLITLLLFLSAHLSDNVSTPWG